MSNCTPLFYRTAAKKKLRTILTQRHKKCSKPKILRTTFTPTVGSSVFQGGMQIVGQDFYPGTHGDATRTLILVSNSQTPSVRKIGLFRIEPKPHQINSFFTFSNHKLFLPVEKILCLPNDKPLNFSLFLSHKSLFRKLFYPSQTQFQAAQPTEFNIFFIIRWK